MWFDGEFTGHWSDSLGLAVTGVGMSWLWFVEPPGDAEREEHDEP